MENKVVVCYIGENVEDFLPLSLESVKDIADTVVFVDGGSKDKTCEIICPYNDDNTGVSTFGEYGMNTYMGRYLIHRKYEHDHKGANGRARNCYLDFIKKHFNGWLCLVLDPDEVVDDRIKYALTHGDVEKLPNNFLLSVHMRHTIRDLAHEDATVNIHFVHNRFFRVCDDLFYPESEHPILTSKSSDVQYGYTNMFTIWHLAYSREMFGIKKKYDNHMTKSNIHTPQYLRGWLTAHLFGKYPVKEFDPTELPSAIKKHFEIIDDELYFKNRGLELKHFLDAWQWKQYFQLSNEGFQVLELGCGLGPRVLAMNMVGINAFGVELSEWAVQHKMHNNIVQGDITTYRDVATYKLVTAYDVLEHLNYDDIDKALETIKIHTNKYVLISVPVIGNPDLLKDKSHRIHESKEWWIQKIESSGLKVVPTPQHFNFANQLIIAEK